MGADISVKASGDAAAPSGVTLEDSAIYWYLYQYFEKANRHPKKGPLIDLYGNSEIGGYQLERLINMLHEAEKDILARPSEWSVMTGWRVVMDKKETERGEMLRKMLSRDKALQTVRSILNLALYAQNRGLSLRSFGD